MDIEIARADAGAPPGARPAPGTDAADPADDRTAILRAAGSPASRSTELPDRSLDGALPNANRIDRKDG
jgi:hypothetical protein